MYKLKINGKSYDEVQGTRDWSKTIERNFNDRVFRTKGDFQFTGWGQLFDLIFSNLNYNGVCESLNARIYFRESKVDDYAEWWRGEIKMQDGQWDLLKDKVDTQVLDDVWAAKFANSEDQKVFLRSTTGKKGTPIAECTSELCDFFDPATGNYDYTNARCFRVFEVFDFLVRYHTDGAVTFASDYFDTGDGSQYYITTGEEIRTQNQGANPEVSFSEMFDEMNKKFCLWIIIETDDFDNPVLRIEPQSYVFEDTKAVEVVDPEGIVLKVDLDQLYTIVNVGSPAVKYNGTDANYPTERFTSWNDESYNTPGDCEFENNTLDLVSTYKIDTNSIEQVLGGTEDFDDNIFIIEIDSYLNAYQYTTDLTLASTVDYIYNFNLTNAEVITRWFDGIPQNIQKDIGKNYYVYADSITPTTCNIPCASVELDFTNDNVFPGSDVDDIYTTAAEAAGDDSSGEFKSPTNALWRVQCKAWLSNVTVSGGSFGSFQLLITVWEDNTRSTILRQTTVNNDTPFLPSGASDTVTADVNIWMETGNVMVFDVIDNVAWNQSFDLDQAYAILSTTKIPYATGTDAPLIYEYEIQRFKLSLADFNTLDNNLGYIRFIDTKKDVRYDVWATELKYNPLSQMVEVGKFIGKPLPIDSVCIWLLEDGAWDDSGCWDDSDEWIDPELDWFIITVKTDNAGVSAADEFQIPTSGSGYNYIVQWGDGQSTIETSTATHTYASPGTYTVRINGDFPRIFFNNGGDRLKLLTIEQWGNIAWASMNAAFYGCSNMTGNYSDVPDLSGATSMRQMFHGCTNFNSPVESFPVSTITDMVSMFRNCSSFDQTLGDWEVTSLVGGQNFMNGAGISTANYDDTLAGWTGWDGVGPTKPVISGVIIGFGTSQYTIATSQAIRDYLTINESWTIADGGGV